jgi:nicotinate-nucleotide adenylyltransferase
VIGLLGGSFDPIHHGHLLAAQAAAEALGLSELRFVAASEQPFKAGRHGATPEHRAAMIELAIGEEPGFRLERCELNRPGPSYTVDTLRELRAREPGAEFVLLVGSDAAVDFPKWREAEVIPRLARVVLFARGGVQPAPGWPVVPVPAVEISATDIRRRVRGGRSIRWWVPAAVAEYIAAHRLYLDGEG